MKGLSKSSIIAAALASFLSPDGGGSAVMPPSPSDWIVFLNQFDKLERDQTILIETLALYVRYFLTVSAPGAGGPAGGGTRTGPCLRFHAVH